MPQQDYITQQQKLTVQEAVRSDQTTGVGFLYWMAQAGQIVAPWWSKTRDQQLRNFHKESDHFLGATWMIATKLAAVPFHVEPRDLSVKSHAKQAEAFNSLLYEQIQFGKGWQEFWFRFLLDLWTADNGAFGEVVGEGKPDGPIVGPVQGLAHLDAFNCTRTSNPEFPVVYNDQSGDGKKYRFHHTRVIYTSQMPSTASEMNGVGVCWLSRAINAAQNLVDISVYKQEKLGSRPLRAILKAKETDADDVLRALAQAEESMDNQGLRRFAKLAIIGLLNPNADLELLELSGLPDGFDERTSIELGLFTIALAGGFPPRWLWPATTTGATRADAMYSHIAGSGGGAAWHVNMMRTLLAGPERGKRHVRGKVLPQHLKLVFDYQDDEQDRMQADIRATRAKTRETDLNTGVTSQRVSREQALSAGDLTQAQFDALELDDGRLPNGDDVLTLFASDDEFFASALRLGVPEVLDVSANDGGAVLLAAKEARLKLTKTMVGASNATLRTKARQAIAALDELDGLYGGGNVEQAAPPVEEVDEMDWEYEGELMGEEGEGGEVKSVPFESKDIGGYRSNIRAAVRALWNGYVDYNGFFDMMSSAVRRGLTDAWREGASECGIKMDELTAEERIELENMIFGQINYIGGFAEAIEQGSKANGGKLAPLFSRSESWINRYNEARTRAAAKACANKKKKFMLGATEEHCRSCASLNGRVYRYQTWEANGALPPSSRFECGGFLCKCTLVDTDERITPGRFPVSLLGG